MPKKREPIKCHPSLGGCKRTCIEVGKAIGYPMEIWGEDGGVYREYRYACPGCRKEFIYDTKKQRVLKVPRSSQYRIKIRSGKEIIFTKDQNIIRRLAKTFSHLKGERRIEMTAEEWQELLSYEQFENRWRPRLF